MGRVTQRCVRVVLVGAATDTIGGGTCVFPFMYGSKPRATCIFNDSNLDDDEHNDGDGAVLTAAA